jgi:hypothetical protein
MKVGSFVLSVLSVLCLAGCATRPKTYQPPDTRRLTAAVEKAAATEARARVHIERAQKSADKIAVTSASAVTQAKELLALVPLELRPRVEALQKDLDSQLAEEGSLSVSLAGARTEHGTLVKDLAEAKIAKLEHEERDKELAQAATEERNYRIAAEEQLSSQRWFGWLWKLGTGLLVVIVGLFFLLKWLGKLGWAAAKIGI